MEPMEHFVRRENVKHLREMLEGTTDEREQRYKSKRLQATTLQRPRLT